MFAKQKKGILICRIHRESEMSKLLIIIPAYNEAENIERVVDNLKHNYPQYDYVVINDGSRDNTAQICKKNGYNLVDGDGQHDPKYISNMLEKAQKENFDVIIGSRFVDEKRPHCLRMLGNTLLDFCIFLMIGKRISDPTSGMSLFNKNLNLSNRIKYLFHTFSSILIGEW